MKKKKYEENKGLTGMGTDYSVYRMKVPEKIAGAAAGAVTGYTVLSIFFGITPVGLIPAAGCAAAGVKIFRKYLKNRRDRELLIQFRDFLGSLSSSLSAGQNISGALVSSGDDIEMQYGAESLMASEIRQIITGMKNNMRAECMIDDFAVRSGQKDIRTFAETFSICSRTGGNMRNVIMRTSGMLSEKMQTESEISVIASKGRNELMIMTLMPLLIVPVLRTLGESGVTGNNPVTVAVKLLGIAVIAAAYAAGRKITDIKI